MSANGKAAAEPLLIEIGCEEIPARMIRRAAADLTAAVVTMLDQAGIGHGAARGRGGSRRLAARVEDVAAGQADRDETVLGPPAQAAFDDQGGLTRAAEGFARKNGLSATELESFETDRGRYVGFRRHIAGRSAAAILAEKLPSAVQAIAFPKTMRWSDGRWRWVRPVHWLLALHGHQVIPAELFGIRAGSTSVGHRFLGSDEVAVGHPDEYETRLDQAYVVVDPERRRTLLLESLESTAKEREADLVADPALLDEVADLVEWPGVVVGRFDSGFLELPRELLVTTLRHHQKCFSLQQSGNGALRAEFLAVANTDRDPHGHVRRGNEWVVGGRLEDARFFWREDRKRKLADRSAALERVVFHARLGSYAEKAERMDGLAGAVAERVGLSKQTGRNCRRAARLCKNDLVSGTVGEFPELQGQVGGLLLRADGEPEQVAIAVYEHYKPVGPEDSIPASQSGRVVALVDKLDTVARLHEVGERPTGSKDPLGLRRAGNGIARILLQSGWPLTIDDLRSVSAGDQRLREFLKDRLVAVLREDGFSANEILAVLRPRVGPEDVYRWAAGDIHARLQAIALVRGRDDFEQLADLTKRVDNILTKGDADFAEARQHAQADADFVETEPAAAALWALVEQATDEIERQEQTKCYGAIIEVLAGFVLPVERFFAEVLVLDRKDPQGTLFRRQQLARLCAVLTRHFDIRELAGQAERRQ